MAQTPRPADAVRIGQVFLDKYRIESILGQGGMGVVAECTHLQLNQRLAIKMLRQDVLADADAKERFMREAQAASKLRSEYVAHVYDVGTLENGTPYMVMEYLEGMDLGQLLTERHKLGIPWTCDLMLQTAEALAEAHSLGIVHRDIKPTNLFVTWRPDGTALIKVLDFGISKSTMGTDMHLTQTQSLLGTPAYMSPEQMRSARLVDARTDIWSLGSVMYELLEGRKPFEAESFSEMCVKVAVDPPTPMYSAPPELQQVVFRCLAKSPEQRYATMAELARDLVPFVADSHQASLLVERMQRVLRRSVEGGWEGTTTGVGQRAVPNHVRDGSASQPVRVPWQESGAIRTPMGVPQSGPVAVPRQTGIEPSAPARAPSDLFPVRKKRAGLWFALTAALVAGAAGIAIALSMGGGGGEGKKAASDPPAAMEKPATAPVQMQVTQPPAPPPSPPAAPAPLAPPAQPTQAVEPATTDTPPIVDTIEKPERPKQPIVKATKTTKGSGAVKTVGKTPPKETSKETKDPPKEPPKADCDIYAHPHGCPN